MADVWEQLLDRLYDEPEPPSFTGDIKRGAGGMISGVGSTLRDLGAERLGQSIEDYGTGLQLRHPSEIQHWTDFITSPVTGVREAVGEMVPQVGGSVLGGIGGRVVGGVLGGMVGGPVGAAIGQQLGGFVGGVAPLAVPTYGNVRSEQREQGIYDPWRAAGVGIASGVLERFGAEQAVSAVVGKGLAETLARGEGASLLGHVGRQAAIGAAIEAGTEIPQSALERFGAYQDVTGAEAYDEYALAGLKGAAGGGVFRGGLSAFAGQQQQQQLPPNPVDLLEPGTQIPLFDVEPPAAPAPAVPLDEPGLYPDPRQGELFDETAAPIPMVGPPVPAPRPTAPVPDTAATQQAKPRPQKAPEPPAVTQEERDVVAIKYGAPTPVEQGGQTVGYKFLGKVYFTPEQLNEQLDRLAKGERGKTGLQRQVEEAFIEAARDPDRPVTPGQVTAQTRPFVQGAQDLEAVITRLEAELSTLDAEGSKATQARIKLLENWRDNLKGIPPEQRVSKIPPETPAEKAAKQSKAKKAETPKTPVYKQGQEPGPVTIIRPGEAGVQEEAPPKATGRFRRVKASEAVPGAVATKGAEEPVQPATSPQADTVVQDTPAATLNSQDSAAQAELFESLLNEAVGNDPIKQQIARMYLVEGMESSEVAKRLGVSASQVRMVGNAKTLGREFYGAARRRGLEDEQIFALLTRHRESVPEQETVVEDPEAATSEVAASMMDEANDEAFDRHDQNLTIRKSAGEQDIEDPNDTKDLSNQWLEAYESGNLAKAKEIEQQLVDRAKETAKIIKTKRNEARERAQEEADEEAAVAPADPDVAAYANEEIDKPTLIERLQERGVNEERARALTRGLKDFTDADLREVVGGRLSTDPEPPAVGKSKGKRGKKDEKSAEEPSRGPRVNETTQEYAERRWNEQVPPGLPRFDELPLGAQEEWIRAARNEVKGGEHTTRGDMQILANRVAKGEWAGDLYARTWESEGVTNRVRIRGVKRFFEHTRVMRDAIADFAALDIKHAFDFVNDWYLADIEGADAIASPSGYGNYRVLLNRKVLDDDVKAAKFIIAHEVGHVVDAATRDDVYSGHPLLQFAEAQDNDIVPVGPVAAEAYLAYLQSGYWYQLLSYPFDETDIRDPRVVQAEVFAQLFAAYITNPTARQRMAEELPISTRFIKEVINVLKATPAARRTTEEGAKKRTEGFDEALGRSALAAEPELKKFLKGRTQGRERAQAGQEEARAIVLWPELGFAESAENPFPDSIVQEPVFHATMKRFKTSDFKAGDIGIHFGTSEQAADRVGYDEAKAGKRRMLKVFIDVRNPLRLEEPSTGGWANLRLVKEALAKAGVQLPTHLSNVIDVIPQFDAHGQVSDAWKQARDRIVQHLRSLGYDSIVYKNLFEGRKAAERASRQFVPSDSYIVFGPEQISAPVYDVRYMKLNPALREKLANETIGRLPEPLQKATKSWWTTLFGQGKKIGLSLALTEDLADMARKYVPSVDKFIAAQKEAMVHRARAEYEVDRIVQMYEKLSLGERGVGPGSVNEFIMESTRSGKWGYKLDPASGFTPDPDMEAKFKKLSPQGQAVVKAVFQHGYNMLQAKKKAVREVIDQEYDAQKAAAGNDKDAVAAIERKRALAHQRWERLMAIQADKPYAPLKRFGEWAVVAKSQAYIDAEQAADNKKLRELEDNENDYYVAFAETEGEAKAMRDQLATAGYASAQHFEREAARDVLFGGSDMFLAFGRLRNVLTEMHGEDSADTTVRALNNMLGDLYLQALAEGSSRKSELRRRNVAGADKDMIRAFATQGRADAHFLAHLRTTDATTEALMGMRREARAHKDRHEAQRFVNEFLKRHELALQYRPHRIEDTLKRLTSVWLLSTSPAYYFQQGVQTFVLSLPVMAGKHGYKRSMAELRRAYDDVLKLAKDASVTQRLNFAKAPADVRDMLKTLVEHGKIDIGLDLDLGKIDSRNTTVNRIDRALRGLNEKVESINRAAAAIAAYRMELARNGGRKDLATKYAEQVVHQTHGSYDGFNTPRAFRAFPFAGLVTQFKRFQIVQLAMLARLFHNSFADVDPKEKAVARRALRYTLTHAAVLGGAVGMPGATMLMWLAGKIFGDEDEPFDTELEIRKLVGPEFATLVTRGVPAALGVDLSGRIGWGNVLSVLPFTDPQISRNGYEKTLTALSGPFLGGVVPRVIDGFRMWLQGDYYKGLEMMLPNGVANVMRGMRFASEGVTMRNGDVVLKPEEITMVDSVFQALGLPTSRITERQFRQRVVAEYDEFYDSRASELRREYVKAYRKGDSRALADVRKEWMELQDARVKNGYRRQPLSSLLRSVAESRRRERTVEGGVVTDRGNRGFVQQLSQM